MLLILGVAGSGKSTQSNLLATQEGMVALSVGELLRRITPSEKQQKMLSGALLDDDYVISAVETELKRLASVSEVILDGFPRTEKQALWLLEQRNNKRYDINAILFLKAEKEHVKERLLDRARPDDKEDAIKERFNEFDLTITAIIKLFSENGVPVIEVNAQQNPNAVFKDLLKGLTNQGIISHDD